MENKTVSPYTIEKALVVSSQPQKTFKVIVVGDSNVGKTSLTFRFCEGKFINNTETTIGVDFREKVVDIDGEKIKLHLWDTAGQERFRNSITAHFYRNIHAFIVMYDVTNRASFDSVESWIEECKKYCFSDIPRILIGNKCDGHHAVPTYEAQQLADKHNMPLFETSAKLDSEDSNIEAIFLTLAYKLKNQKLLIPQPINVAAIEASNKNLAYNSNNSSCC